MPFYSSFVFTSWIKDLRTVLRTLIFIPHKEALANIKPQKFEHITQDINFIIYVTKLFIETEKNP